MDFLFNVLIWVGVVILHIFIGFMALFVDKRQEKTPIRRLQSLLVSNKPSNQNKINLSFIIKHQR